jgi:phosphoglycolate phosphatase-like HAD superfamily hydrolase
VYVNDSRGRIMKLPTKQWCLSASALLITAATFLLASSVGAQDPCDALADKLLEAKLYDKAQLAYAQIERAAARDGTQTPECVKAGLGQIFQARAEATRHYERGQEYEVLEKPELARDEYVEALRADPTFAEASAALDRLLQSPVTPQDRFQLVLALERVGLHEAATEELKEAIKAAPEEPVPAKVKNAVSGTVLGWSDFRRLVEPWVRTIAEVLIGLLLLVVLYRFVRWLGRQLRLRLDIQDFDKGTTGLELGKALPSLVEEAFRKVDTQGGRTRVGLLTGPIEKDKLLSNIGSADPRLNIISQLVDTIAPPKVVTLAGSLQRSKARGAGLSLTLTESRTGNMLGARTIWLRDYDPKTAQITDDPKPYYDLAELAAIWTLYRLHARGIEERDDT